MREAQQLDAHIAAAIKVVEELEAIVSMLGAFGDKDDGPLRISLAAALREIAALLDRLPLAANDLVVIKRRLRALMTIDPEKTPRPVSLRDLEAVRPEDETKYSSVEEERRESRTQTRPGLGIPMPKRDR